MAINLHFIQTRHLGRAPGQGTMLPVLPPLRRTTFAAAGLSSAFIAGSKVYSLANYGDAVWVRVNQGSDVTQAGSGDDKSIYLPATIGSWDFMLPSDVDPTLYKLDVRAA